MSNKPYATHETIREGATIASTVEIRSDLLVDLDEAGRVVGVERIADEVRFRDLCDVLSAARIVEVDG